MSLKALASPVAAEEQKWVGGDASEGRPLLFVLWDFLTQEIALFKKEM